MGASQQATGAQLRPDLGRAGTRPHDPVVYCHGCLTGSDDRRVTIEVTRWWVIVVATSTLILGLVTGGLIRDAASTDLPACPTEDSVSCYWDGDTMGNGNGVSFVNDADGVSHYLTEDKPWE
jgi:hypothetical protein